MKTVSKRRMFVSSMKISAWWLLHRWIKFNKICWEKKPAKTRPNLRTSFWRLHLKNTQPYLNNSASLNFFRWFSFIRTDRPKRRVWKWILLSVLNATVISAFSTQGTQPRRFFVYEFVCLCVCVYAHVWATYSPYATWAFKAWWLFTPSLSPKARVVT